jgi:hypothetical protein
VEFDKIVHHGKIVLLLATVRFDEKFAEFNADVAVLHAVTARFDEKFAELDAAVAVFDAAVAVFDAVTERFELNRQLGNNAFDVLNPRLRPSTAAFELQAIPGSTD